MSGCKCFSVPIPRIKIFGERLNLSKCKCESRYVVSENKRTFCIDKTNIDLSQIDKIKIDGFFEPDQTIKKCDYLFIYKELNKKEIAYVFVELKGKDIKHAVEQLKISIDTFNREGFLKDKKVRGAIVCSYVPKDNGSYRKAKLELISEYSKNKMDFSLQQKNKKMEYKPLTDEFI